MSTEGEAIYAEPEELPNAAGPANDLESADLKWKEYNLLSLGTFSISRTFQTH
jgi:hypothetical protein